MKLNATSEMIPITWPEFANMHPFAPADQRAGYAALDRRSCERWLCAATGYARHQPAAQRRLPGRVRRPAGDPRLARARSGQGHRDICLIPAAAHGTNPASAADGRAARWWSTACDEQGNVDMDDLQAKCERAQRARWRRVMITYPSDPRRVRDGIGQGTLRAGAPARRAGLRGRRQHERAGRPGRARRVRRRRLRT